MSTHEAEGGVEDGRCGSRGGPLPGRDQPDAVAERLELLAAAPEGRSVAGCRVRGVPPVGRAGFHRDQEQPVHGTAQQWSDPVTAVQHGVDRVQAETDADANNVEVVQHRRRRSLAEADMPVVVSAQEGNGHLLSGHDDDLSEVRGETAEQPGGSLPQRRNMPRRVGRRRGERIDGNERRRCH